MVKIKYLGLLLCTFLFSVASAVGQVTTGLVGSMTWTFTSSDGKLIVAGSGTMGDMDASDSWRQKITLANVKSVEIGNLITDVSKFAFRGMSNLAKVTFVSGSKVAAIGDEAFKGTAITSISLPESVKTIGNWAFEGSKLTKFVVPKNLTLFGNGAVSNAPIASFDVSANSKYSVATTHGSSILLEGNVIVASVSSIKTLEMPRTALKIRGGAFHGCKSLVNVICCSNLEEIGSNAFWGCTSLKSLHFYTNPDVDANAFNGVILSDIYVTAKSAAMRTKLSGTLGFTHVYNSQCGGNVYWYLLDGNTLCLTADDIAGDNRQMMDYESSSAAAAALSYMSLKNIITKIEFKKSTGSTARYITKIGKYCFYDLKRVTSVSGECGQIVSIGDYAFNRCEVLSSVNWNGFSKLTTIGSCAFQFCAFTSISIPTVTKLGSYAFGSNDNLKTVTLPKLAEVGSEAFNGAAIESFTLPSTLTTISLNMFARCSKLKTLASNSTTFPASGGNVYNADKTTLYIGTAAGAKEILSGTKTIHPNAFIGMKATELKLPESVCDFGNHCFDGNDFVLINDERTDTTHIASGKTLAGAYFSSATKSNCLVYVKNEKVKKQYTDAGFTASNVMTSGCGARTTWNFTESTGSLVISGIGVVSSTPWLPALKEKIRSVSISASITSLADASFNGCANLTSVSLGVNSKITSLGSQSFRNTSISSFEVPSGVKTLQTGLFEGCSKLSILKLPSGLTELNNYCLSGTSSLTKLDLPASLETISEGALKGSALTSVDLPNGLKSIGADAFVSTKIKSLKIPVSVQTIGTGIATNSSLERIEVNADNEAFTSTDADGNQLNMLLSKSGGNLYCLPKTNGNVTLSDKVFAIKKGAFVGEVGKLYLPGRGMQIESWPTSARAIYANNVGTLVDATSGVRGTKVYAAGSQIKSNYETAGFTNVVATTHCGSDVYYVIEDGVLTILGSGNATSAPGWKTPENAAAVKRVIITPGVTGLYDGSFYNFSNLTDIRMPEGFANLGNNSLEGCTSLKSLDFPSTANNFPNVLLGSSLERVTIATGGTFRTTDKNGEELNLVICDSYGVVGTPPTLTAAVCYGIDPNIPNGPTEIVSKAFEGSSFAEISIPVSVTKLGADAFAGNTALATIYWGATTATGIANAGFEAVVKKRAKVYVPNATVKDAFVSAGFADSRVVVADGTAGGGVYYSISGTKLILFGSGEMAAASRSGSGKEQVIARAWKNAAGTDKTANIKSLTIANGITSIAIRAFENCMALAGEVLIPRTVTSIGLGAFGKATGITAVTAQTLKPATMADNAFPASVYAGASLTVPDEAKKAYSDAQGWERFGVVRKSADIKNRYDLNEDGRVNVTDAQVLKDNM